jgi:hypothetical protein
MARHSRDDKWCWEKWISTCRRKKFDPCLTPYAKINSKCIKHLNIRAKNYEILRRKHWGSFVTLELPVISPKAWTKKKDQTTSKLKTSAHQRTK